MREIKFRAWDVVEGKYFIPDFIDAYGTVHYVDRYEGCFAYDNECVLEQFTGLCDKNGKEIYEGDILKDGYNQIGTCYWEPSNWVFINHGGFVDDGGRWEVVGNIHENPELLK